MNSEQSVFIKSTMNYGLITGLVLIVYSMVSYGVDLFLNKYLSIIFLVLILTLSIYFTAKHFRDKKLNGYIKYSSALGIGTMTGVFAGILLAFFSYLYVKFDPTILVKQIELAQQQYLESGMSEDQVELMTKVVSSPAVIFVSTIFTFAFYAFIISLITSAILKKNQDPFASQMEGIDNN